MDKITHVLNQPFFQEQTNRQLVYVLAIVAFASLVLIGASLIDKKGGAP